MVDTNLPRPSQKKSGKGKKLRRCGKDRKKRELYRSQNRCLKNKASRIYRRIRNYKNPARQLNGLNSSKRLSCELKIKVATKLSG